MSALLLVDLSIIFRAAWHSTEDLAIGEAFERTLRKVRSLVSGHEYVAICLDCPPYHRKEISQEYKAQRDKPEPQMLDQFERIKERLRADGLLLWGSPGFESDDVIAWATNAARKAKMSVTIASSDKDLLSLVDDEYGVRVLSTASDKMYQREQVIEKMGVSPDMIPDFLSLTGDSSDNIKGVPGVGPVKAAKLLMVYGTLDEVLANADKQTPALRDALIEHAGAARLAKRLVTLRTDVPLDFSELFKERKAMPLTPEAEYDEETGEIAESVADDFISPPKPDSEPFQPKPAPKSDPPPSPETPMPATAGIVVRDNWELRLEPQTGSDAFALAKVIYNSRLYTKFSNHQAIFAVILRGREMGLSALTALDCFHVVEGRPVPQAHLIIAKAKAHPDCEYFQMISSSATAAEYKTKNRRNPEPTFLRYTIEQAKEVGLLAPSKRTGAPSMWVKRPDEMLRKTCATQLARIEYPEAAMGLYSLEELDGSE